MPTSGLIASSPCCGSSRIESEPPRWGRRRPCGAKLARTLSAADTPHDSARKAPTICYPLRVTSPDPHSAPKKSALLVLVPMGIVLVGIAGLAAYFLWPRGERVGAIDLRGDEPSMSVDLAAG